MSTKTSLLIFGIVAMSVALIAAASLTNFAIAAKTDNNDDGKSKSDKGSGSTSSNDNQLSKKQVKEISSCISDANKGPGGLSSKKVRDCYDQTVGLPTSTAGSTLPGLSNTNTSSTK
jgi:hypothetical protein